MTNLPSDLIPSALSYDWLGMTIYLAGMNSTDRSFGIWKFALAAETLHHLFKKAMENEVQVTMVMNPFTGYARLFVQVGLCFTVALVFICVYSHLYWTEHSTISVAATLHQLNLRDNTMMTLVSSSSDLQLSPALALDSTTDKLWVFDQSTGSILSCYPLVITGVVFCQVEVDTSLLLNSTSRSKSTCF